jgi:5-methylcytosine-specific restriction protein A
MPAPSVREHLTALVGSEIPTISGVPNRILEVAGDNVIVGTERSPDGQPVPLADIQAAADRVFHREEVRIDPDSVGYRSAFVGAVLRSMPGVEVLEGPQRARLASGSAQRNPAWQYDELILALDLYLRRGQPPTSDPEVVVLSSLLNRLPIHVDRPDATRFRNPNGVHMKLANWKRLDPTYSGAGLTGGGHREEEVWHRFASDPQALVAAVERITATANGNAPTLPPEEDEGESVEGRILFRVHRVRERDPSLVKRKKAAELRRDGGLACEVCDIDFAHTYGPLGEGFIECHHTMPLATAGTRTTVLDDLALVCPNCHRMLHRSHDTLSIAALRAIVRDEASGR